MLNFRFYFVVPRLFKFINKFKLLSNCIMICKGKTKKKERNKVDEQKNRERK